MAGDSGAKIFVAWYGECAKFQAPFIASQYTDAADAGVDIEIACALQRGNERALDGQALVVSHNLYPCSHGYLAIVINPSRTFKEREESGSLPLYLQSRENRMICPAFTDN
jgi:hypothetical protein